MNIAAVVLFWYILWNCLKIVEVEKKYIFVVSFWFYLCIFCGTIIFLLTRLLQLMSFLFCFGQPCFPLNLKKIEYYLMLLWIIISSWFIFNFCLAWAFQKKRNFKLIHCWTTSKICINLQVVRLESLLLRNWIIVKLCPPFLQSIS